MTQYSYDYNTLKIKPCLDIDPGNDSWDPGRDQTNHIILLLFRPDFDPD